LFCKKTTSGKIFMSTNDLYNEEALEVKPGFQGELFVPLFSKKQITIPVRGQLTVA
jgi:hypothetical protein